MLLNSDKTEFMNILINRKHHYNDPILLDNNISIIPSNTVKFLGVTIDDHITFSNHITNIIRRCNSRLYLLRQLKILGMNTDGLKNFYIANIRSIISYASPSWFSMLSGGDKARLEKVQRTATRFILPNFDYDERISILALYQNYVIFSLTLVNGILIR